MKKIIKIPCTRHGQFLFFFLSQAAYYGIVVANGRAFNQALYVPTCVTDVMLATHSFFIYRLIAKDENSSGAWPLAGTVSGGAAGSLLSIWMTKMVFGH